MGGHRVSKSVAKEPAFAAKIESRGIAENHTRIKRLLSVRGLAVQVSRDLCNAWVVPAFA
jgi:hypothetical protein